jgi:hypothetical protein
MPLKKAKRKSELQSAISANIRELMADNKKKGKEKGAGGKARSKKQILAIAISAAKGK